jgi:CubicO group peptidase (beta-lactamase class C family)
VASARLDVLYGPLVPDGPGFGPVPDAAATELLPNGTPLVGVVHDENARAMEGVAPHAGLFGSARDVHALVLALLGGSLVSRATLETFWRDAGVPDSTWCLGWDRPSPNGYSSAGSRLSRDAVGHLGFTGCSLWIDPARPLWIVLLSNRIHPTRENNRLREFRPILHDAICAALD